MRKVAIGVIAAVLAYSASYGIAFAGIYAREDSRIEAARWIDERIPAGSRIGLEQGAFTMRGMISDYKYRVHILSTGWLFSMRGYATCRAEVNWLRDHFQEVDYLAIIEENRYQQYKAVPDLIPGGAAFFRALVDEELGFELIHRFRRYPSLGSLDFRDDGRDPTFTGYDHPAVLIFRKRDDAAWQEGLDRLRERLSSSAHCADAFLEKAASALGAGEIDQSLAWTRMAARRVPQNRIAHLIEANLLARAGRPKQKQEASRRYHADLRAGDRIAADGFLATGMSLFELGLKDLALSALKAVVSSAESDERVAREPMARIYMDLADHLNDENELDEGAADILLLSTRLHPTPAACNRLAVRAIERKDYEQSATYLRQSLELDANQAGVHAALGHIAAKMDDPATAQRHFHRALELNPALEDDLGPITVPRE